MRRYGSSATALAVVLAALLVPASASAATTIGSDLAAVPDFDFTCPADCTVAFRTLPGHQVTAPFDGVIVRWRIGVGPSSDAQPVKLRVVRGTGTSKTGAGSSQAELVPAAEGTYLFGTRLPVVAGDFIGIDCCAGATTDGTFFRTTITEAELDYWSPPLGDGQTRMRDSRETYEMMVNADLEPDCDADGFGDETQDPNISSCHPRTLTLDANKNKVKKGKKVTLTGRVTQTRQGGTACAANQGVELQRKKPSQTTFTTVEQLQTDAAGNFSAKEKVKKTFEYRFQVPETATCDDGLSNTEKVKVKKKK
jgi:hypothetical protein